MVKLKNLETDLIWFEPGQRVAISKSFLSCNKYLSFREQIVTGDEKSVLCANLKIRLQGVHKNEILQSSPKTDLHPKKVMLCIW